MVPSPTLNNLSDVDMTSAGEGWAVGSGGQILHYTGGAWNLATSPTSNDLSAIDMVSNTEGWAVGNGGTILHYTYGGGWQSVSSPAGEYVGLYALDMVTASDGWIMGLREVFSGKVLRYLNGSWSIYATNVTETMRDIEMESSEGGLGSGRSRHDCPL